MNEPKNGISEDAQRVLDIFSVKEHIIDKDLGKLESRLNDRINEVKKDLHDRISRLESRLQWRMTIIFAGVGIFVSILTIVVPLIFKHFSSKIP